MSGRCIGGVVLEHARTVGTGCAGPIRTRPACACGKLRTPVDPGGDPRGEVLRAAVGGDPEAVGGGGRPLVGELVADDAGPASETAPPAARARTRARAHPGRSLADEPGGGAACGRPRRTRRVGAPAEVASTITPPSRGPRRRRAVPARVDGAALGVAVRARAGALDGSMPARSLRMPSEESTADRPPLPAPRRASTCRWRRGRTPQQQRQARAPGEALGERRAAPSAARGRAPRAAAPVSWAARSRSTFARTSARTVQKKRQQRVGCPGRRRRRGSRARARAPGRRRGGRRP